MSTSGHKTAKGFAYALAVLIILMIVGVCASIIVLISKGSEWMKDENISPELVSFNDKFTDINKIYVDCGSNRFSFTEDDVDDIIVYCKNVPEGYQVNQKGKTLEIPMMEFRWSLFSPHIEQASIEVVVPRGFELDELDFHGGSGHYEIDVNKINVTKIDTSSGSGDISNIHTDRFLMNSSSGSVSLKNINTKELFIDSGSGSVKMENMQSDTIEVLSSSGKISYEGSANGDIKLDSGSGSVVFKLDAKIADYNIEIDDGSGGVWINNTKCADGVIRSINAKYNLSINGASGRVTVGFLN